MEIVETKYRLRCEMGLCKNMAKYTVNVCRSGLNSKIHICEDCTKELYSLLGDKLVPKSIETCKPKNSEAVIKRGKKNAREEN